MRALFFCAVLAFSTFELAPAQDTNFANGPQYLMNGSPLFARPIATPSMALKDPPLEVGASVATGVLIAGAQNETVVPPRAVDVPSIDLLPIFYGYGRDSASVIEISFAESSSESPLTELPTSILDTGAGQITTAQALRERGYGVTVGEAAAHEKAHARHANHVYTNSDIDRLHGRS
jgi:hypothetical protein